MAFCDLAMSAFVSAATTGADGAASLDATLERIVSRDERSESRDSATVAVDEEPDVDAALALVDLLAGVDDDAAAELCAYSVGTFAATRSTSLLTASIVGS